MKNKNSNQSLEELRKIQKVSQENIAFEAGLSISTVKKYLHKNDGNPRLKTIYRLSKALGITPVEVLKRLMQTEENKNK